MLHNLTNKNRRQHVIDNLHFQWLINQTLSVSLFNVCIGGTFGNDKWFKHTLCVKYLTCIHYYFIRIFSEKKSDTIWYQITVFIWNTFCCLIIISCSIYWFLIHFIIKNLSSIWYNWIERSHQPIAVCPYLK